MEAFSTLLWCNETASKTTQPIFHYTYYTLIHSAFFFPAEGIKSEAFPYSIFVLNMLMFIYNKYIHLYYTEKCCKGKTDIGIQKHIFLLAPQSFLFSLQPKYENSYKSLKYIHITSCLFIRLTYSSPKFGSFIVVSLFCLIRIAGIIS